MFLEMDVLTYAIQVFLKILALVFGERAVGLGLLFLLAGGLFLARDRFGFLGRQRTIFYATGNSRSLDSLPRVNAAIPIRTRGLSGILSTGLAAACLIGACPLTGMLATAASSSFGLECRS